MNSADQAFADLVSASTDEVRNLATRARAMIKAVIPEAIEEVDPPDHLVGFTFQPGTIKGSIVAISLQRSYVNIMFSKGVELLEQDSAGLLEGTGKAARHIKVRGAEQLDQPAVRDLIRAAADRTPH